MKKTPIIVVLIWALTLQLTLGNIAPLKASAATGDQALTPENVHLAVADALADPAFSSIENDPTVSFKLDLNTNDPLVDQDPFFLRTQSWTTSKAINDSDDFEASSDAATATIALPNLNKSWKLNLPVHPILQTDNYIFFAVNDGAKLFDSGTTGDSSRGEGFFLVRTNELMSASVSQERVPVFFFPMPGDGWQSTVSTDIGAQEIPQHDVIVFSNTNGLLLPVALDDVDLMVKAQNLNLFLATLGAVDKAFDAIAQNSGQLEDLRNRMLESFRPLTQAPTSESVSDQIVTQAQSSYVALLNKINSIAGTKDLVMPRGSTAGFGMLYTGFDLDQGTDSRVFQVTQKNSLKNMLQWVLDRVGSAPAYAMVGPLAVFGARTAVILAKTAVVFAVGVVLRYTVLRKTVEMRLQNGGLKSKASVPWTILAQSLTVLSQAPMVWPANGLKYILDKAGMAENGRVRRLFNATFGYALQSNDRTPVDSRSLILGILILGGIDTAMVALQQYWVIPHLAHLIGVVFPILASRVAAAYTVHNTNIALYNLITVLSNFVAWLTTGAPTYAGNIQSMVTNEAMRTEGQKMRDEGLNPDDPKNKNILDARVSDAVRAALNRQGLPDERTFLFDANSIYQSVQSFAGYSVPQGKNARDYYGVTRQGLMPKVLDQAIQAAQASHQDDAVTVLQGAQKDFSLLKAFTSSPRSFMSPQGILNIAHAYKRVRSELVSFTYKGTPSDPVEMSQTWAARSPTGALPAAQIFRQQYFALLNLSSTPDDANKNQGFDPQETESGFSRWQLRRAINRANMKFVRQAKQDPANLYTGATDDKTLTLQNQYEDILKTELLDAVGLYPDAQEAALITDIETQANTEFQQKISTTPAFSAYLDSIPPFERAKVSAIYKSDIFAQSYVAATIKGERVPPLSPAQPGRFQRLRQTQFVRNSVLTTRAVRFAEGFFSNARYSRGLGSKLMRDVVPMLDDQISGNLRALRLLPINAIFGYFWNSHIWNATLPYKDYLINYTFRGSTVVAPWATDQRINDNEGWKAGESKSSMAKYAFIGSWFTFTGSLFYGLFHGDIEHGMNAIGTVCEIALKSIGL